MTESRWVILDIAFDPELLGFLPEILLPDDPRPVREQLAERYTHGGGYNPFKGFTLDSGTMTLTYPGDPPLRPGALLKIGKEVVFYYPRGSWLLIMQTDKSWVVTRVD